MGNSENCIQQIEELKKERNDCRAELEELKLRLGEERAAREAARQESKNKASFVAVLSHEIRNPVNGIVAMSDLLTDTELDEEQRSYLDIVRSSSDSLMELVNGILDMSRLEAGKMTVANNPFDLINTIEDLVYMLAPQAFGKNVDVVMDIEAEIPLFVVGDVFKVRQIFLNLLQNAIKFTHEGEIVFGLKRLPSLSDDKVVVGFSVRDTGIGMSEEQLARMFDVYAQVHDSSNHHYGGAGLGLTITKNLIELLGGRIEVSSRTGEGTEIEVILSFERYTDIPSIPFEDDVLDALRLLLLDRPSTGSKVIVDMLQSWGAVVEQAERLTPELAGRAEKGEFDVVLADRGTVSEDEVFQSLRETPGLHLFLLAKLGEKVEDEERIHFRSVVTKPIRKLHLLNAVLAMDKNSRD
ncbi:sensor histidine kinase [Saccharibacillus alkalitolerans]|uniref:histidine kinase n=1 Tax=Saccharibacillus alkalitolerans TaxID=2705290 RepID=A0ABX0FAL1_9BACL|nr:ATP-binding protein [Saccharibacillus alkalitolerans]NGZ77004.1 hypothetical protein [Saccharibacillus alkalitolerans]